MKSRLSPSVTYLVSVLDQRIRSGVYLHGRWLPAERALSEEFAVCRPTVRQAISELERRNLIRREAGHRPVVWHENNAGLENEPVPQTIHRAEKTEGSAGDENVRPQSVCLWISGESVDPGPMAMTGTIYRALSRSGGERRLMVTCPRGGSLTERIRSEAEELTKIAADADIGGVILWYLGGMENLPVLQSLRYQGKALVFVDRKPPEGFEADYVGVNNEYGALEATRHLIALGHRRIAHITNSDQASSVQERFAGYQRALEEAGLAFSPGSVLNGPFSGGAPFAEEQEWQRLVEKMLRLPERPTAVFAVNDYAATRLIVAARANGLRVPDDLAVVGFDNSDRWAVVNPFVSSVSQPFDQVGEEAVRLLWSV